MQRMTRVALGIGAIGIAALAGGCGPQREAPLTAMSYCVAWPGSSAQKRMDGLMLDTDSPDRRRWGISLASAHKWGRQKPYLDVYSQMLREDPEPTVRAKAATALGRGGDPAFAGVLAKALEDPAEEVRWRAARALNAVIAPDATAALVRHARRDSSVDVRLECARALGRYKQPETARVLAECLTDGDFSVRHAAHGGLIAARGSDLGWEREDWLPALESMGLPPGEANRERP